MNQDEIQKELDESRKTLENLIKFNPDELDETFESEKKYLEGKIMAYEIAIMSDGNLPEKCPHCNEIVIWEWSSWEILDEQHTNDAKCPKCQTVFSEIMEVIGWEEKQ